MQYLPKEQEESTSRRRGEKRRLRNREAAGEKLKEERVRDDSIKYIIKYGGAATRTMMSMGIDHDNVQ